MTYVLVSFCVIFAHIGGANALDDDLFSISLSFSVA